MDNLVQFLVNLNGFQRAVRIILNNLVSGHFECLSNFWNIEVTRTPDEITSNQSLIPYFMYEILPMLDYSCVLVPRDKVAEETPRVLVDKNTRAARTRYK